jgi:hypothetical protein
MRRPLAGLGFGLAASGPAWAGSYRCSAGTSCSGAGAMACTHRGGGPGYRWGRGPDWTTTGVIRPVTEITSSIDITIHRFTRDWTDQVFVDAALTLQAAWCAVGQVAAVVDLAGREPAIRHDQGTAMPHGLVRQHRRNQSHGGIRDRPAKRPPAHTAFHRGHIEILYHDLTVGARQLGSELVGSFPPQMHAPPIEAGQLGFR